MKKLYRSHLVHAFHALALFLFLTISAQAQTVTIWPVGDSITKGVGGEPYIGTSGFSRHYRAYLVNTLVAENISYDFLGSQSLGSNYLTGTAMVDPDHEGHGGQGAVFFNQNLGSTIPWPAQDPDFILFNLGTNDIINATPSQTSQTFNWLLNNMLRANCPTSTIIVQGIGERTDTTTNSTRAEMNNVLETIVNNMRSGGDTNIYYVQNTTTLADLDPDGIHPTYTGHEKIANQFWSVMQPLLPNTTPTAPAAPTNPVATSSSATSITVSWTDASSNEEGFTIERSTTSGSGFALAGTVGAGVESFVDNGLTTGTTYYYRIKANHSSLGDSAFTSEVSATPQVNTTLTIMPLGDSITHGVGGTFIGATMQHGYRADLENIFRDPANNIDYDFVGSLRFGSNDQAPTASGVSMVRMNNPRNFTGDGQPMYDMDHEGRSGYKIDDFYKSSLWDDDSAPYANFLQQAFRSNNTPDIVLFMLGTNHRAQTVNQTLLNKYTQIFDDIYAEAPNTHIIVSQIPPNTEYPNFPPALNPALKTLVQNRIAAGDSMAWVEPNILTSELADPHHPNRAGHLKQANAYWGAIQNYLDNQQSPSGYTSWADTNMPSANTTQKAMTYDYDGDGVANLIEYAMGGNPAQGADDLYSVTTSGNYLSITFKRDTSASDMTIAVERASSLSGPWTKIAESINGANVTASGSFPTGNITNGSGTTVTVTDNVPVSSSPAFLRITVSQ